MHNHDVEKREGKEPFVKGDDSQRESTGFGKPSFQFAYKKRVPFFKKKTCIICQRSLELELEYKNVALLRRFISERGKILPRRLTGNCMRHQRFATRAIKQARVMALLWFV